MSGSNDPFASAAAERERAQKEAAEAKADVLAALGAGAVAAPPESNSKDAKSALQRAEEARRERREKEGRSSVPAPAAAAAPAKPARASSPAAAAAAAAPQATPAGATGGGGGFFSRLKFGGRTAAEPIPLAGDSPEASAAPASRAPPRRSGPNVHTIGESSAAAPRQAGYNYDSEAGRRQQGAVTSAALGGGVHGGQPGMAYMQDPVWGVYEVDTSKGAGHAMCFSLKVSCCPCCVQPCTESRKAAWRRLFRSASWWIAIIDVIMLIVSISIQGFAPPSVNPMLGPPGNVLNMLQAKNSAEIVYNKMLQRLVLCIILHAGIIHLVGNLSASLRLGTMMEYEIGKLRWLLLYFGAGIMGSVFSAIFNKSAITVGASGAIAGIMGAYLTVLMLQSGQGDLAAQRARMMSMFSITFSIVFLLIMSFIPFIDWAAHLFGLIGGALLTMWQQGYLADGPEVAAAHMRDLTAPLSPRGGEPGSTGRLAHWVSGHGRSCLSPFACRGAWTKGRVITVFGLVAFVGMMMGGLLGLFFNTEPPRALLYY